MDDWKRLICRGNRCFERGDFACARTVYLEALDVSERLLPAWPDADAAVAAFVVSHHNLADLYVHLDCLDEAGDHLQAAHATLMRMVCDERAAPSLQEAALRHSQRTRAEMLRFAARHGAPDTAMRRLSGFTDSAVIPFVH